jgi:hypothetical protein
MTVLKNYNVTVNLPATTVTKEVAAPQYPTYTTQSTLTTKPTTMCDGY